MDEILDSNQNLAQIDHFKSKLLLYWAPVLVFGMLFKIMHWPGSSVLIVLATAGVGAYTLSGFIRLKGSHSENNIAAIINLVWIVVLLSGAVFFGGHPFNFNGVLAYVILFAACFGIQEIIKAVRKSNQKKKK
jgi:hypothetical protein